MSSPIKVAILDDYQNIALPHLQKLDPSKVEIKVFRDTLLPYNHPATPDHVKSELVERLKPFTIISAMRERTPFPAQLLEQLPNLKLLISTGLRNASLDLEAAKSLGIRVVGAPGKGRSAGAKATGPDSTTTHTIALILGISRNIANDDAVVKAGGWQSDLSVVISDKTFGTVGLGKLGVSVCKIMHVAFGMKIIAWSSSLTQEAADEKAKAAGLPVADESGEKTFKVVSKEELFKTADVVSVHYVLSDRSRGIVSKKDLSLMKKTSLFINTSRGPLVVEEDLLDLLKAGKIRGAALDVFDLEPLPKDSQWRTTKWGVDGKSHVLLTPHMAYVEDEGMGLWYDEIAEHIQKWVDGKDPINVMA